MRGRLIYGKAPPSVDPWALQPRTERQLFLFKTPRRSFEVDQNQQARNCLYFLYSEQASIGSSGHAGTQFANALRSDRAIPPLDCGGIGAIGTRKDGVWTQLGRKLVGSGAAGVGNAPVLCEALRRRALG